MQKTVKIQSYTLARMTNFTTARGVIVVYGESDSVIGRLEFRETNVPTSLTMASGYPTLYFPIEAFPDIVDILRNEQPTYLVYEETVGYGRITTDKEAVGEGENASV